MRSNRISNRFNSTQQQHIWDSKKNVCRSVSAKVLNSERQSSILQKTSITDLLQDSKDPTGLHFKNFSIQFTLHQSRKLI